MLAPRERCARSAAAVAVAAATALAVAGCASSSPVAGNGGAPQTGNGAKARVVAPRYVPQAIRVAVSPAKGAAAAPTSPLVLRFSRPISAAAHPALSPTVAGSWAQTGPQELTFRPATFWLPSAHERVSVPAFHNAAGDTLAAAYSSEFRVQGGSTQALQQALARTGYLPLAFAGSGVTNPFAPAAGAFTWRYPNVPAGLRALWSPGKITALTTGALMAFQDAHGLARDAVAGPQVWTALLADEGAGTTSARPYTWVAVHKNTPQNLQVWKDGAFVQNTPVNTGVSGADTPIGSYPVYARFASQTMRGTNPDGSKYDDPGVPWINYFYGGDAVHGFPRSSYGSPQSNGCVELPVAAAQQVFNTIGYGTVVTVSS